MDERRKYAYRFLLYWAMLDVRTVAWLSLSCNLFAWPGLVRRVRRAGATADWLHNLALFSALDFRNFDEGRFWNDFESLRKRYPDVDLNHYRWAFDRALSEADESVGRFP